MRPYELVVLLHPDLEIDADTPIAKIEKLIEANGGKITKRDNWGKKRLAYAIKRQQFAIYVYFEIDMDPTAVRKLEQNILITEEVIRHLLVRHVEAPEVSEEDENKSGDGAQGKPAEVTAEGSGE